ncbi:hypothetical protein ACX3P5_20285 (plasmid) [Pantoea sp. S-LA4]|uniref:hypothetical protein n=1 Tax=Pantoea TaxID=53335 RepID=UPI001F385888|nr:MULTISPECIES: hypothetical protein [Pantoea]UIL54918.1 hypothetical protein LZU96_22415 [Pantoea agglomerans]
MNNESQKKTIIISIPIRAILALIIGMVVFLMSYLYSHYAVASPLPVIPAPGTHAQLIVYRVDGDTSPASNKVVNVFLNNQYHTSILPHNRAVKLILCPGAGSLDISIGQLDQHRFGRSENLPGSSTTFQAGKRYFYQIALNSQNAVTARWVPEEEAEKALFNVEPHLLTLFSVANEHCLT